MHSINICADSYDEAKDLASFSAHYCKEINSVLYKDERPVAQVKDYVLYNKTKFIFKLEDLSGKASYILHKMGVLPQDLNKI